MVLPTSSPMIATKIAVGRNNQKIERAQKHRDIRTVDASNEACSKGWAEGYDQGFKEGYGEAKAMRELFGEGE
jgi:hypothetical protein